MRTALIHWVLGYIDETTLHSFYKLSPYSYFSESAYSGDKNWK
jgi:hypothetical protein